MTPVELAGCSAHRRDCRFAAVLVAAGVPPAGTRQLSVRRSRSRRWRRRGHVAFAVATADLPGRQPDTSPDRGLAVRRVALQQHIVARRSRTWASANRCARSDLRRASRT